MARPKVTSGVACEILGGIGARPGQTDFHELSSAKVDRLLEWADHYKYRKPRNANGSRGRYFFEFVQRKCR